MAIDYFFLKFYQFDKLNSKKKHKNMKSDTQDLWRSEKENKNSFNNKW